MKSQKLIGVVISAVLKLIVAVAVVYAVYRGAMTCYSYGYRIFTEPAVSSGTGRTVTITLKEDATATELGELFAEKGLVKDAKLFALQYMFSEYREDLIPGTYELSTAMTAEEMMEVMATPVTPEGE
ncbi:MAG: endolytic transglycosylase MltG [Lachnoclostridium sp.]|nr:endolytic transglycosylase MltG [Lachnospira sp.]MCM1249360.1 endolytic transglycosylase MltG [Lachnoclostridium sp.]MCM1535292.1 endolytic transglycosylase MltG [Clostridium sp.]